MRESQFEHWQNFFCEFRKKDLSVLRSIFRMRRLNSVDNRNNVDYAYFSYDFQNLVW